MRLTILTAGGAALLLSACATVDTAIPLTSPYSPYAHMIVGGQNSISGNALLRTSGGDVKTCAGYPVKLMPDTPYSRERMSHVYGSTERGYGATPKQFTPPNPHFEREAGQMTTCDSQGNFQFTGLADGSYFLISMVTWNVHGHNGYWETTSAQGGSLMQRVNVSGGQTARVVLTR